jgi:hypothetical protein
MKQKLFIATGAPGAGKSAVLEVLLQQSPRYIFFDIDWLSKVASELAGKSIYFERSTWQAYARVWFSVLDAVYKNGKTPVLFAPFDKDDIAHYGVPEWCDGVEWLLLDCSDDTRSQRLRGREWPAERIEEALQDARKLRETIPDQLDTSTSAPAEAAQRVTAWLDARRA